MQALSQRLTVKHDLTSLSERYGEQISAAQSEKQYNVGQAYLAYWQSNDVLWSASQLKPCQLDRIKATKAVVYKNKKGTEFVRRSFNLQDVEVCSATLMSIPDRPSIISICLQELARTVLAATASPTGNIRPADYELPEDYFKRLSPRFKYCANPIPSVKNRCEYYDCSGLSRHDDKS